MSVVFPGHSPSVLFNVTIDRDSGPISSGFIIAHILSVLQRLTFLNILRLSQTKQALYFSWLCNVFYIFKTSLYSL